MGPQAINREIKQSVSGFNRLSLSGIWIDYLATIACQLEQAQRQLLVSGKPTSFPQGENNSPTSCNIHCQKVPFQRGCSGAGSLGRLCSSAVFFSCQSHYTRSSSGDQHSWVSCKNPQVPQVFSSVRCSLADLHPIPKRKIAWDLFGGLFGCGVVPGGVRICFPIYLD